MMNTDGSSAMPETKNRKGPVDMKEMIKASSAFSVLSSIKMDFTDLIFFVFQRTRTRSGYAETLEKLRKEFNDRWAKNTSSSTEGLKDFERLTTLGTGSFGRVVRFNIQD